MMIASCIKEITKISFNSLIFIVYNYCYLLLSILFKAQNYIDYVFWLLLCVQSSIYGLTNMEVHQYKEKNWHLQRR